MADPTFTAVDLSRLSSPDAVETLDYETILGDAVAVFRAEMAAAGITFDGRESDPATKLLQAFAYLAQMMRQRVNEAARAVMAAHAVGADLDNIAALFGIMRKVITPADDANGIPAVMESDTEFRRRMVLAPEGYSVAGPEGAYVFHALSADAEVLDATATSPAPGEVVLSLLSRLGDGTASQRLVDVVQAYVSSDTRRPLTDLVTVQSAQIIGYLIDYDLTAFNGPDGTLILTNSLASVQAYVDESHRLGRDITLSALYRAAHVEGAQNIRLNSPTADIVITRTQAPYCTGVAGRLAGTGE